MRKSVTLQDKTEKTISDTQDMNTKYNKMLCRAVAVLATATALTGCMKYKDLYDQGRAETEEKYSVMENAKGVFGEIDSKQDWNMLATGLVTITANAPLEDVARVEVLTAPPFGNGKARVVAAMDAQAGQTVTLSYEAPKALTRLFAACRDSRGHYYVKGFKPAAQATVTFQDAQAQKAPRRATALPDASTLTLDRVWASYNNIRCRRANEGDNTSNISLWAGSQWEQDTLWQLSDKAEQTIILQATEMTADERADLKAITDAYLQHEKGWYSDNVSNVEKVRNSKLNQQHNYLTTTGGPIALTPVQIWGSEQGACHLYYYYYNPADMEGKDEVEYLKSLPKYKAIQVWRTAGKTGLSDNLFRMHTYQLVYYGDGRPQQGQKAVGFDFPQGYKIGFMMRKMKSGNADQAETQYVAGKNGEVYGDGRLNQEINVWQLPNKNDTHFATAGMEPTDPRMAFFVANQRLYMTVEDGSNRDFSDIIIEVEGAVETAEADAPEDPEAEAYTLCFEDRPLTADYDLNDVVLRCRRLSITELEVALVATGAADQVYIHGADGWPLNDREVHEAFGIDPAATGSERFVNTMVGGVERQPLTYVVNVGTGVTIPQYLRDIYIENRTTGKVIRCAGKGEPPYAIIVPTGFKYPMEFQPITRAYTSFLSWAQNVNTAGDWYLFEDAGKVFPTLFW